MNPVTRVARSPGTLDEPNRLRGYAARFGEESEPLTDPKVCKCPFVEVIAPGAFARTLRDNPDILALFNHDWNHVLGRTGSGTLKLWEDGQGLPFDLSLPDTTVARDLRESLRRGDYGGCSFFGYVIEDELTPRAGLPPLRTIREIELVEITPATARPAYSTTSVALRSRPDAPPAADPAPRPLFGLAAARLTLSRD